jgi:hypothetical protein
MWCLSAPVDRLAYFYALLLVIVVIVIFVAIVETICRRWLATVPAIKV